MKIHTSVSGEVGAGGILIFLKNDVAKACLEQAHTRAQSGGHIHSYTELSTETQAGNENKHELTMELFLI